MIVESVSSEASNVMDGMTVVMAVMREQFVVSLTLKMVEFIVWVVLWVSSFSWLQWQFASLDGPYTIDNLVTGYVSKLSMLILCY